MKNPIATLAIMTLLLLGMTVTALAHGRFSERPPNQIHVGVSVVPLQLSGLVDAYISDGKTQEQEGRISLPLAAGNTDGMGLAPGMKIGYVYDLVGPLTLVGEVGAHFTDSLTILTAQVGVDMFIVDGKTLKIGIPIRVGGLFARMDFGKVRLLEGYNEPPVIIENDAGEDQFFRPGDALSAELLGPLVSAGVAAEYYLAPRLGLRAELGFSMGFFDEMKIKAGNEEIPFDHPAVIKTDETQTSAGIEPEGGSFGLSGFVGVVYRL
jgi:hypothetical protein